MSLENKRFECQILDASAGFWGDNRHSQATAEYRKCVVEMQQDRMVVTKKGFFTGAAKGNQTIYYDNISNVDLDMGFFLGQVTISFKGSDVTVFRANKSGITQIKDWIDEAIEEFRSTQQNNVNGGNNNLSTADELSKLADLLNNGTIDENEFQLLKNKLLMDS